MEYLIICGSTMIAYLIVMVIIRLFSKKEISKLSVYDLGFLLLITNAVYDMMAKPDTSFFNGLYMVGTLIVVNYLFKYIIYRFPNISKLIRKSDIMLIYNGKVHKGNLARARISITEIEKISNAHGIKSIDQINLAVLEVNGDISVLSDEYKVSFKEKREPYQEGF